MGDRLEGQSHLGSVTWWGLSRVLGREGKEVEEGRDATGVRCRVGVRSSASAHFHALLAGGGGYTTCPSCYPPAGCGNEDLDLLSSLQI